MSPEQANGREATERSDVYGLGATLYHLFTGSPPLEGTDRAQIRRQVLQSEALPVRDLNPKVPPRVADIVEKAMAKNSADRYGTPGEMRKELAKVLAEIETKRKPLPKKGGGWFKR